MIISKLVKSPTANAMTNKLVSSVLHKDLIVPAIAITGLFANAEQLEVESEKASYLANNIGPAIISTLFQKIPGALPITAATTILIRTFGKANLRDKISSLTNDSIWLGCGLAAQKLLSGKFWYKKMPVPRGIFGYLSSLCAFIAGATCVAPLVNKFVNKNFIDVVFPKPNPTAQAILESNNQSAIPAQFDKYNIGAITNPKSSHSQSKPE